MPYNFEQTSMWRRTLAPQPEDLYATARETLRAVYLAFRTTVEPLAAEICRSLPAFTDHSIAHSDALWGTASQICGEHFPINAAEAFVLGGTFLIHDLGMGLASYRQSVDDLKVDPQFGDLCASATVRLQRADPWGNAEVREREATDQAVADLLRLRHADQAEQLMTTVFDTSDREPFFLIADPVLRHAFGSLIGQIARSHGQDVSELRRFEQLQGSSQDHPTCWEVDPLKIACVLRLADVTHIDHSRAPTYLHAFRKPTGVSRDHWHFQERLTRPRIDGDRLIYTAMRPFGRDQAAAWWLAYEAISGIDAELRQVDALCADLGRPRFAVRSAAGANAPERLARYIHADRWEPLDARLRVTDAPHLIANLGGEDLYGHKPDIAMRELVANAADATRARRVHEGGHGSAVTVRLSRDSCQWWLEVSDHGVGMSPETMAGALTDFGHSRWHSAEMLHEFPGLLAKGFKPTGLFGIGFFAVFMVADEVEVRSLAYDEAPRNTYVLEFQNGLATRPLLRAADSHERLRVSGTTVRARLRCDPLSIDGLFKTTNRRLSHTQLLHSRLTRMCALSDVDVKAQGPDDPCPVRMVQGGEWKRISASELFRRIYRRDEASHLDRLIYDGYEKIFVDQASELCDEDGELIGRAMVSSGWEQVHPDLVWRQQPTAPIYVGGFEAGELYYSMGAFVGRPLKADRLTSFPVANLPQLQRWLDGQGAAIRAGCWYSAWDYDELGFVIRLWGADAAALPCVVSAIGGLNREELIAWLGDREEVFLLSFGSLRWVNRDGLPPRFFTLRGGEIVLPVNYLIVNMNPEWIVPEEIAPRPRDERFADVVESDSGWDLRAWWYDTGNFGASGLAVRTIADAWGIDVVRAVKLMEPFHLQDDGEDRRPTLETADGDIVRVAAIRMRRPR